MKSEPTHHEEIFVPLIIATSALLSAPNRFPLFVQTLIVIGSCHLAFLFVRVSSYFHIGKANSHVRVRDGQISRKKNPPELCATVKSS